MARNTLHSHFGYIHLLKYLYSYFWFKKVNINANFVDSLKDQKFNFIILLFALLVPTKISAQTIPVGTPILEEAYRRAQLLGNADSTVSFTVRPISPSASFKKKQIYSPFENEQEEQGNHLDGSFHFGWNKGVVQILPFSWQQQFNTHHPYSLNDGDMIPARGYQTMISGGVYAQYGPLSIQLRPEYVYAQNRDYQGFYKEQSDQVWAGYYDILNYIDLPEKFGNNSYKKLSWGQSSIRITAGPVSIGLSNENLWWGPGIRNSFIMSNTAPGFKHITLNTVKPIKTFLGSFEGQIICGRLEDSRFAPPDTNRTYNGSKLYYSKRSDWRYINGIVISYQPKWIPGLFLGATRTFIAYYKDMGHRFVDFLPIVSPITKKANYGEKESSYANDQRASVFIRWLWQKEKAELYWELGRDDHAFNLRDYLVDPDHTRAYVIGFRKLIPLNAHKDQYIQFNIELTQLALTTTNPERPQGSIYLHYAGISQGYTHEGQLLGAGIGPGSNMQMVGISWVKSLKTIGIQIERYVHNNDFQTSTIQDMRSNWVDFSTAAIGEWDYKNFLVSFRLEIIRSYNYQYLYRPMPGALPFYWDPGRDIYNYQAKLGMSYRF
ncbi:MAG: hypothetical protein NTY07_00385 [Bacteroidia bacterium]|nr:hypothetical protein [Bacteroidia bacterium]